MTHTLLRTLFILLATLATGFAQSIPAGTNTQTSDVAHLMINYEADQGSLSRFYTVTNSPERRERFRTLYTTYLDQLAQLNFDRMTTDSRVDYLLFRRDLQEQLHDLTDEEREVKQIQSWFPFADKIYAVEKLRRRGTALNAEQLAPISPPSTRNYWRPERSLRRPKRPARLFCAGPRGRPKDCSRP